MSKKQNNKKNTGIPRAIIEEILPLSGKSVTTGGSIGVGGIMGDANFNSTSTKVKGDETKLFLGGIDAIEAFKLAQNLSEVLSNQKEKDDSENIISLNIEFGNKGDMLQNQLEAQGYKLSNHAIGRLEFNRGTLLRLEDEGLLKKSEVQKAFYRMTEKIAKKIAKQRYGKGVKMVNAEK
jgi:hypothetical protein